MRRKEECERQTVPAPRARRYRSVLSSACATAPLQEQHALSPTGVPDSPAVASHHARVAGLVVLQSSYGQSRSLPDNSGSRFDAPRSGRLQSAARTPSSSPGFVGFLERPSLTGTTYGSVAYDGYRRHTRSPAASRIPIRSTIVLHAGRSAFFLPILRARCLPSPLRARLATTPSLFLGAIPNHSLARLGHPAHGPGSC